MKILDRYVTSSFVKNYLLSFMILVGLYIILDMLFNFDDLMSVQTKEGLTGAASVWGLLRTITDYYFYQTFLIFVQLSGIIPIVAAAFTLMRMSRQNELSAILSAGVPLLRVATPIIIAAVVLNGLLLVDQEVVVPLMIPKLARTHNEAGQDQGNAFQIHALQDENRNLLLAAKYYPDPRSPYMREVTIIERNDQLQPTAQITAERAEWERGKAQWRLVNARRVTGLAPGQRPRIDKNYKQPYHGGITPEEVSLYRSNEYVNLLSTERINQLLNKSTYGINQLLRVKNTRFTQPFMNIILLLLGIPCVLTRQPGQLRAAAVKTLIFSGLCMATVFVSSMLAGTPPNPAWAWQWPALMAWVPIVLFGPVAVFLLDRIET
jgi:lipopolysaccharide export LptBFGC system permease protein LptF